MRLDAARIAIALCLLTGAIAAQEVLPPPQLPPSAKLTDHINAREEYYSRIGKVKGTGFRPYTRQLEFVKPRSYPSGDMVNLTALTWLHHFQTARSPAFQASKAAAAAAGIVANWRQVKPTEEEQGTDAGRINAIAFDPTEPATIYAGTPAGGLWRTRDDGVTWSPLTDALPMLAVNDIAIDPNSPRTIYVLTGDGESAGYGIAPPSIGIIKSTDGGETWNSTGLIWKTEQVEFGFRLAIHPTTPAILLAGTTKGLLRTTDGGDTWTAVAEGTRLNPFWDVLFHPTNPSIVYAASQTNVYRSSDAGATWTKLGGGLPSPTERASTRIRLAVSPAGPDTLYVLYAAPSGFTLGLWRSDNRGDTFTRRSNSNPPPSPNNPTPPFDLSKPNILHEANNFNGLQASYDLAMAVSPTNIDRVHVGGLDTWRSDDGGRTWHMTSAWRALAGSPNYTHADVHVLAYRDDALFTGTDGGVYRSDDAGDSWRSITDAGVGGAIRQIYSICISPDEPNMLLYGSQDNGTYRLELDGQLTRVLGGDGMVCRINPKDANLAYASVYFGMIFKSETGGSGFDNTPISPQAAGEGAWVTPYVLGVDDPNQIYACFADIWRGSEGADNKWQWSNLTRGAVGTSRQCAQIAIAPSDPKTIYVGKAGDQRSWRQPSGQASWPPFLGGGGVFRSNDGGATWQTVSGTLPFGEAQITDLAISPTDPQRVWVTFSGYKAGIKAFTTTDGGRTWTNLSTGLANLPVHVVTAQKSTANAIYIGTDAGVFYRDDRSNQWLPYGEGMPTVIVTAMAIDEERKRIFAATYGRGIYVSDLPCQENCPTPQRSVQSLTGPPARPRGYVGPVNVFE